MNGTVLVVDDEERIRSSLRGILSDEGFRVVDTGNAPSVMEIIAREKPSVVLLDVWMPGLDGIELLRRIKSEEPGTHVIMISGHANIQNAVAATRLGAEDFIEKPFSVNGLLTSIERVLNGEAIGTRAPSDAPAEAHAAAPRPSVAARPQRTVRQSVVIGGQGLHSGLKTGVILHPAPVGTGIIFSSLADQSAIPALLENVTETGYNTTLSANGHSVRTVEHLTSTLHGFGITNLIVKTDDEVPALDGSAAEFCKSLRENGVQDQTGFVEPIRVRETIRVGQGSEYMEIAPARTFGFVREFHKFTEMGLARGGRLDNLILVDDEKVVNTTLRFADEFARHKVLDMIGDLYLLGRPIVGHITASKTGHSDNLALLRAIAGSL